MAARPADELAVDDVVAVDRLGQQARQGSLRALAVDPVEAECDTQQRTEERDERREWRDLADLTGEQDEEDRRLAADVRSHVAQAAGHGVDRGSTGQRQDDRQQQETKAGYLVGEFLRGDDAPSGSNPAARERSPERFPRRVAFAAVGGRSRLLAPLGANWQRF